MQAAPSPLLGKLHKIRTQGISLDVAANRDEVFVVLNRKRFEAALVNMARARAVPMRVPALRMG